MTDINSILNLPSINRTASLSASFVLLTFLSGTAQSVVLTYTDEAAYLADLSSYTMLSESFEGSEWDSVRSTAFDLKVLPSITNLGLTWQHRFFPDGSVTTSDGGGYVHDGVWQFFAWPHGGYHIADLNCTLPGVCGAGFTITSDVAGTLYGVGGWFTGSGGPVIKFLLDGILVEACLTATSTWQFCGVIDTDGFSMVEIMDSSGTVGDQNLLWADDFTIGISSAGPDSDGDGTPDSSDNCINEPNGPTIPDAGGNVQRDTDSDGFGNVCDPDFNGDLIVNATDLAHFKTKFFTNDNHTDLNGDGIVNAADLAVLKTFFFKAPGPSGIVP